MSTSRKLIFLLENSDVQLIAVVLARRMSSGGEQSGNVRSAGNLRFRRECLTHAMQRPRYF